MRKLQSLLLWVFGLVLLSGCILGLEGCSSNPRVVRVPATVDVNGVPSDLIRIGPDTKGYVFVFTDDGWVQSDGKVTIPEGWFAGPVKEN